MTVSKSEHGNALFYILIAIALIAALTFAIASSLRGNAGISTERTGIIAADIIATGNRVAEAVGIPILHIADCVGERMARDGVKNAALLGTSNVMTESFYRQRLVAHGVDLLPPDLKVVETLDRIIYGQLTCGKVTRDAERTLKTIITVKGQEGARAIVLAATELDLVVDVDANVLPIYDGTRIHAEKGAEWILGEG